MNNESNNLNGTVLGNTNSNPADSATPMGLQDAIQGVQNNSTPAGNLGNLGGPDPVMASGNNVITPNGGTPVGAPGTPVVEPTTSPINPEPSVTDNQVVGAAPAPMPSPAMDDQVVMGSPVVEPTNQSQVVTPGQTPANTQDVNSVVTPNPVPNPNPTPAGVQPTPTPAPNYTNPQAINPAPMPGFESAGTVGTTPPINLENGKKGKKPNNKLAFIIIIVGVLLLVGIGTWYVLNHPELLNKKAQITIETKAIDINMGDALPNDMASFASVSGTNLENCTKDVTQVDITKAGTYSFTIKCGDKSKVGTINVIDNTELAVTTQTVYKSVGDSKFEASEFAGASSTSLTFSFVNEADVTSHLTTPGTYDVALTASNVDGKSAEVTGKLIVLENKIKGHLNCTSNEQNVTGTSATMVVNGSYGIADADGNPFGKKAIESYQFKFADETEYQTYVTAYQTDKTITLNNITGDANNVTFDDANHIITITLDIAESEVNTKYGITNFANYSSIRSYFTGLGYTCTYQN